MMTTVTMMMWARECLHTAAIYLVYEFIGELCKTFIDLIYVFLIRFTSFNCSLCVCTHILLCVCARARVCRTSFFSFSFVFIVSIPNPIFVSISFCIRFSAHLLIVSTLLFCFSLFFRFKMYFHFNINLFCHFKNVYSLDSQTTHHRYLQALIYVKEFLNFKMIFCFYFFVFLTVFFSSSSTICVLVWVSKSVRVYLKRLYTL